MIADLSEIRGRIIDSKAPVLMDAADVAVALDCSLHSVLENFDNMVMAGDRYLIRAVEVRERLIAMQPKAAAPASRFCLSCGEPLAADRRRFCSTRCSDLTPSGRARLREKIALENPRQTAGFSIPQIVKFVTTSTGGLGELGQPLPPSIMPEIDVLRGPSP